LSADAYTDAALTSNQQKEDRTFFRELSRRHVFGSAIAYVVSSWVLIQVADIIGEAFGAPDWIVRALATVLLLLFPAFVVFSWEFNLTKRGFERAGEDLDGGWSAKPVARRSIVGLVSALSLAAIWWTWQAGVLTDESFKKGDDDFPKIIAVDGFRTFAAEGSEWLGDGISNLVRDNFAQSRYLRVISLRRWRAIAGDNTEEDVVSLAASADIEYLIHGEIIGNRNGFVLTVRLTDTRDGEQLDAQTYEVDEEGSLLERATSIAQNARARLKVPVQEQVDIYAADFAADNPSAYRAYTGALDYWINYEFAQAERLLAAAIELQPDFAMARYHLSRVLASQDKLTEALALIEQAGEHAEKRETGYIDAFRLLLDRDVDASIEAYQALIEEYPNDTELRWLLATAYDIGYDSAAAAAVYATLTRLEPEIGEGWSALAYHLIQTGDYEHARPALEEFIKLAPENPNGFVLRGDLNRATRNLAAARDDYLRAIDKGSELQEAQVSLGQVQYLMGDTDAALRTLDALIRNVEAVPRFRMDAAFQAGGILNSLDRYADYVAYLDLLEPEFIGSEIFLAKSLSEKAMALMWHSEPTEEVATLINKAIESSPGVPSRYLFARGLYELARQELEAIEKTAAEIRTFALPPENPDRTEDKAADYLLGRAAILREDYDAAIEFLERAIGADGHEYRLYQSAHAEALQKTGNNNEARDVLESVVAVTDFVSPRLDLERDRQLARGMLASYGK